MKEKRGRTVTEARPPSGAGRAGAKRRRRPLPLREAMYRRVLELRNEGLSYRQIQKRIYEEFGEKLHTGQISEWVRRIRRPTGRVRYELRICPELAWLLGALKGDGNERFKHGKRHYYTIELTAKPELVELFVETVPRVINRSPPPIRPAERGLVKAQFKCARLHYLLSDFSELREVVESSLEMAAAFLQGLFDADGSVTRRILRLHNSDFLLLCYAQRLLSKLGIESTGPHLDTEKGRKFRNPNGTVYEQRKDIFYIYIKSKSLQTFYEKVGFRIPRKRRKLKEAIGLPLKPPPTPSFFSPTSASNS